MIARLYTHDETVAQMDHANAIAKVMEEGRKIPCHIFATNYIPLMRPPLLKRDAPPHAAEPTWEDQAFPPDQFEPAEVMNYRNRTAAGMTELNTVFTKWLSSELHIPEEKLFGGLKKGDGCLACGLSVNSTLMPAIFSSSLFHKGDEVLMCTPIYGMLPQAANAEDLKIVALQARPDNEYKPDVESIKQALMVHPNARALMLVDPANPTGTYLNRKEIAAIADVVEEHNRDRPRDKQLIVVVDETFRHMIWPRPFPFKEDKAYRARGMRYPEFFPMAADPKLHNHTITLSSFSKELAPGMGFAYAFGSPDFMKPINERVREAVSVDTMLKATAYFSEDKQANEALATHRMVNMSSYAIQFMKLGGSMLQLNKRMKRMFGNDREYISMPCDTVAGFHVAMCFKGLQGMHVPDAQAGEVSVLNSSADLAKSLMEKEGVITYPGEMFYMDGDDMVLRFSVNLKRQMGELISRMENYCLSLERPGQDVGPPEHAQKLKSPGTTPSAGR